MTQDPPRAALLTADRQSLGGPSQRLRQANLPSRDERRAGRPSLSSDSGLCDSYLKPDMASACVLVCSRVEKIARRLFGRNRADGDKLRCGVRPGLASASSERQ